VLDYLTAALDIIYPLNCGGCDAPGSTICRDCLDTFLPVDDKISCPLCGRPVGAPLMCGGCMSRKHYFSAGHFGFLFSDRLRDALLAFKFRDRKDVGRFLLSLLSEKLKTLSARYDVIVPLPVTEGRLRERGFNQTYVLSEEIARIMNKPIDCRSLVKTRETEDQYTLGRNERRRNLRGAFAVKNNENIKGRRILLVDDLFTTGSTVSEASKALLQAKTGCVEVFALARTP
jgi:ComF family protein